MAMFMIIRRFFIVSSREGVKTDNSVYGVTHTAFTKSRLDMIRVPPDGNYVPSTNGTVPVIKFNWDPLSDGYGWSEGATLPAIVIHPPVPEDEANKLLAGLRLVEDVVQS